MAAVSRNQMFGLKSRLEAGDLPGLFLGARVWRELTCKHRKPIHPEPISAQTSGKIAVQIGISIARFIDKMK